MMPLNWWKTIPAQRQISSSIRYESFPALPLSYSLRSCCTLFSIENGLWIFYDLTPLVQSRAGICRHILYPEAASTRKFCGGQQGSGAEEHSQNSGGMWSLLLFHRKFHFRPCSSSCRCAQGMNISHAMPSDYLVPPMRVRRDAFLMQEKACRWRLWKILTIIHM